MIGEAVDTAHRIITAATLWAGAVGGAAGSYRRVNSLRP